MHEERPPAKVNLTLGVFGRRPDGFHELVSVFLRVGLSDRLTLELGTGPDDQLTVTGLPGAPTEGNLVLKALDALRRHVGVDLPPLDVTLDKRIPAAAGLGGGSSDAASALHLAQAAWGIGVAPDGEIHLAESLGSDVPFFYSGAAAGLVHGRGEGLSSLPTYRIEEIGLLLVTPSFRLSTAQVFRRYDDLEGEATTTASVMNEEISSLLYTEPTADDLIALAPQLRGANDLWPAAASLEPSLPHLRDELERVTAVPWMMSGSGPTLFALYRSPGEAAEAGKRIVSAESESLRGAIINAVDLTGPEPLWRNP